QEGVAHAEWFEELLAHDAAVGAAAAIRPADQLGEHRVADDDAVDDARARAAFPQRRAGRRDGGFGDGRQVRGRARGWGRRPAAGRAPPVRGAWPGAENSGTGPATGVVNVKWPRSIARSTSATVSCLPIDMVTNGCAASTRRPVARSANPCCAW